MDEKKVKEAIEYLKSLIYVRKRTLAALPTSVRKDSLYNNEITALETAIEALEKPVSYTHLKKINTEKQLIVQDTMRHRKKKKKLKLRKQRLWMQSEHVIHWTIF